MVPLLSFVTVLAWLIAVLGTGVLIVSIWASDPSTEWRLGFVLSVVVSWAWIIARNLT